MSTPPPRVRQLGQADYTPTWEAMRAFTERRGEADRDQLWLVEHPPVFTLGLAGRREHLLDPGNIPVVATDRGGQVTYHGPGQVVLYPLLQLRRYGLGVRRLVTLLEQSVVDLLAAQGIDGATRADAPGVYVDGAKVAALGLRIRRGCSYHGLALNVALDLEPFQRINPCGHPGMAVTDLRTLGANLDWQQAADTLTHHVLHRLDLCLRASVPGGD